MRRSLLLAFGPALLAACGSDPAPPPPHPTELFVRVTDSATGAPIAGARVQLLERGQVLTTGADGTVTASFDPAKDLGVETVRAQAAGHVPFPHPGRLPSYVTLVKEQTVILRLALDPRPGVAGNGTISGKVTKAGAPVKGALVVAGATGYFSGVTDATGAYAILGVTPDFYTVTAFVPGHSSTSRAAVDLSAGGTKDNIDLALTDATGGRVHGQLTGGTGTSSVALVHPGSGDLIPGLSVRADLSGTYTIDQVPLGDFRVAAGLELDGFVLDPQWIRKSGAPTISLTATSSSATADLQITPAIQGDFSPTRSATVSATPTLSWPGVDGATFYVPEVTNAVGQVVYGGFDTRGNPRPAILAPATTAIPDAPLAPGSYTWRVFAAKEVTTGEVFVLIGASEVFGGEFRVGP